MIIPDVNLLLYAYLPAFPEHTRAREWWSALLDGDETVGLAHVALFAFLRISTNRRILDRPLAADAAVDIAQSWVERPNVEIVTPGERHLEIAFRLLRDAGTAGDLTTDVQLAALAIELDAELHSNDSDFARFGDVRWVNPFAARRRR